MYSVLIQDQNTMESFRQFHPLFMEAINGGRLGVCQWLEAGTTVGTAVPELYSLIQDKEEWRAVIVRIEEEPGSEVHPAAPDNPYDFLENASSEYLIRENPIPLVRLTQMLGGIPSPQMHFKSELVCEDNMAPRMIYLPVVSEEDEAAYQQLSEKYRFEGSPPVEIILVSLREARDARAEAAKKAWDIPDEINSSDFWRRNGYPSACRFTFYEMERRGPVQRSADLFKVWTAVMLLALNDIDSNTLQAYRLHRLDVDFNKREMGACVQKSAARAAGARRYIQKSIQREIERKLLEEPTLPDYKLEIPVVLNLPANGDFLPKTGLFHLTSSAHASDMALWKKMQEEAEAGVRAVNTCAKRALDQTAGKMRQYCQYDQAHIAPLSSYQIEDFHGELDLLSHQIFDLRGHLPCSEAADMDKMAALSKHVREKLLKRVTTLQALQGYAFAAVLFVLSLIPAVFFYLHNGWGSWRGIALSALAGLTLFGLAELAMLFIQKLELQYAVQSFRSLVGQGVERVSKSTDMFSKYMSGIASHIHGSSYLSLLQRKVFLQDEDQSHKQAHLKAIDLFINQLKKWSAAFHLSWELDAFESIEPVLVDTEVPPRANPLYTFETKASYSVPVNFTGDTVEAPFGFIERLHIKREELYDDAG